MRSYYKPEELPDKLVSKLLRGDEEVEALEELGDLTICDHLYELGEEGVAMQCSDHAPAGLLCQPCMIEHVGGCHSTRHNCDQCGAANGYDQVVVDDGEEMPVRTPSGKAAVYTGTLVLTAFRLCIDCQLAYLVLNDG